MKLTHCANVAMAAVVAMLSSSCSSSTGGSSSAAASGGDSGDQRSGSGGGSSGAVSGSGGQPTVDDTGGRMGSGGARATGGASGSGGLFGSGGTAATGGRSGSGGASTTGGATSSGGQAGGATGGTVPGGSGAGNSTGGDSGSGGQATSGGAVSSGGTELTGGQPATGGSTSTGGVTVAEGGDSGTGGEANAGAAGEAGRPDYQPCPADGSACKILPYGDSITQGFPFAAEGGYRAPLFRLALADNKKTTFIGNLLDGPDQVDGVSFPRNHEGHFAMSIEWLTDSRNVPDSVIGSAHIVLLHAGTNNRSGQPADAAKKLEALVDRIIAVAPDALLVVSTIIPCGDNGPEDAFVRAYDPLIPPIVEERAKDGKHVMLVDQFATFTPSTMFSPPEKYHPNLVGYAHMADVWYAAIESLLPSVGNASDAALPEIQ